MGNEQIKTMPNNFKAFEDKINRIWWGKYSMWYNSSCRHSIKDSLLRLKGTHVPLWSASCQNMRKLVRYKSFLKFLHAYVNNWVILWKLKRPRFMNSSFNQLLFTPKVTGFPGNLGQYASYRLIDLRQSLYTLTFAYIHTYIHKLYLSSDFSVAYIASISDPN